MRPLILAAVSLAAPAQAQTPRPMLDYASAATIREGCIAWAKERSLRLSIVVLEPTGAPVTMAHMDGASGSARELAQWKAGSAALYGRPTADFATTPPTVGLPKAATIAGGVPIFTRDGVLLGGVGVSGTKAADDAACATAGVEKAGLLAARPAPPQ